MAKLIVVGSSSRGNQYAVECSDGILLIEAGMSVEQTRRMVDMSRVVGCIVSHRHGDHSLYIKDYARRVRTYAPQDTIDHRKSLGVAVSEGKSYEMGGFSIAPFKVAHSNPDGSECPALGYLVYHEEIGSLLFITDTMCVPYKFRHVSHFLIEANYCDDLLDKAVSKGQTHPAQRRRIHLSHMNINATLEGLRQCGTSHTRDIFLIHLSTRHSDPKRFERIVREEFGVPCHAVAKGMVYDL